MATIFSGDKKNTEKYIAFFDLDKTITGSVSGKELAWEAFKRGFMNPLGLVRAIYLSMLFRLKLRDPYKIIEAMTGWTAGMAEKDMIQLSSEVLHSVLMPSVYEEARKEIEMHKTNGARVVILSSSITTICMEMANNLGIDDVLCTELEVENGYLTGRPSGRICYGAEKLTRFKDYCEKNNAIVSETWYYGDSVSDLPVLCLTGKPVCVNPDKELVKEALKRGWKIVRWGL
jgi:putative phosphoserine phosphatase/1-acylglycerol-3-phosphate O-acyltransferase